MAEWAVWSRSQWRGVAGICALIAGWVILLCLQTFARSVCTIGWFSFWLLLLLSVGALGATVWAAVKDSRWWVLATLPAAVLLLSVLGTFEGC
jgi:hypothetical protein